MINPLNDYDRWDVVAVLATRFDLTYLEMVIHLRAAEAHLNETEAWDEDGSKLDWRVMLADTTVKSIRGEL